MNYILTDAIQEGVIETMVSVITPNQLSYLRISSAKKKSRSFIAICKKSGLNPDSEDVAIAWFHIANRRRRGLI